MTADIERVAREAFGFGEFAGRGEATASTSSFEVGARVVHGEWGEGVVQRYDGDLMVVLFDAVG